VEYVFEVCLLINALAAITNMT